MSAAAKRWPGARAPLTGRRRTRRRARRTLAAAALGAAALLAAGCSGPRPVATGEQASSFSLPALINSGHPISLSDYAGKPVIINFCASWSPPCAAETKLLGHYYRYFHGKVAIIGVDARDWRGAGLRQLRNSLVTYPVATDKTLAVGSKYHVPGLPATYFLDARHRIVETELGWLNWKKIRAGVAAMKSGKLIGHPGGE
jgi:peroxiredoxin